MAIGYRLSPNHRLGLWLAAFTEKPLAEQAVYVGRSLRERIAGPRPAGYSHAVPTR
jgi:hypothetical protein